MAELGDGESDDRTVISEPPSPAMLAALAAPPPPARRGRRRVRLPAGRGVGTAGVADPDAARRAVAGGRRGGGYAGGVLRADLVRRGRFRERLGRAGPDAGHHSLPAQEKIIPRAQPATRPARRSRGRPGQAARARRCRQACGRPPAEAAPAAAKVAEATPPPAAPARRAVVAAPARPVAAAPAKPSVVKADRPARRTAAVNRRLAAKKKKFVDPFE